MKAPAVTGSAFCTSSEQLIVFGGQKKAPRYERTDELFVYGMCEIQTVESSKRKTKKQKEEIGKRTKTVSHLQNCKRLICEES